MDGMDSFNVEKSKYFKHFIVSTGWYHHLYGSPHKVFPVGYTSRLQKPLGLTVPLQIKQSLWFPLINKLERKKVIF